MRRLLVNSSVHLVLVALAGVLAVTAPAYAQPTPTTNWQDVEIDWGATANWTGGVPTSSSVAGIGAAGPSGAGLIDFGATIRPVGALVYAPNAATFDTIGPGIRISGSGGFGIVVGTGNDQRLGSGGVVEIASSQTWQINGLLNVTGNVTESGGAHSITKTGAGTLQLSGNNSFTGGMTLNAGLTIFDGAGGSASLVGGPVVLNNSGTQLRLGGPDGTGSNAIGSGVSLTVNAGTTLTTQNQTTHQLYALTLAGGTITSGTLPVTSTTAYTLNNTVNATAGNSTITAPINLNNAARTFNVSAGATLTVSGGMANPTSGPANGLVKSGGGTMIVSGANTYTGGTTISAGTLQLGAANTLANSGAVTIAGGATFGTGGFTDDVGSLNLGGAGTKTIALGAGAHTITFDGLAAGAGGNLVISGYVPGSTRVLLDSDANVASYISNITFTGFGSTFLVPSGTQFELTPIPEPATTLAAGAALVAGLVSLRRGRAVVA